MLVRGRFSGAEGGLGGGGGRGRLVRGAWVETNRGGLGKRAAFCAESVVLDKWRCCWLCRFFPS